MGYLPIRESLSPRQPPGKSYPEPHHRTHKPPGCVQHLELGVEAEEGEEGGAGEGGEEEGGEEGLDGVGWVGGLLERRRTARW